MPIAARLTFQPTVPATLALTQHPPAAHFVSTAFHFLLLIHANRRHYSRFTGRSKPPIHLGYRRLCHKSTAFTFSKYLSSIIFM
jgi:hypothetical protein